MTQIRAFIRSQSGASAAEFALVLPVLLLFLFGIIEFGMLFYTSTQLNWASEDAARCASVRRDCRPAGVFASTNTTNFARARYKGLAAANFTATNSGSCGKLSTNTAVNTGYVVSGNTVFTINLGVYYKNLNIASSACFP